MRFHYFLETKQKCRRYECIRKVFSEALDCISISIQEITTFNFSAVALFLAYFRSYRHKEKPVLEIQAAEKIDLFCQSRSDEAHSKPICFDRKQSDDNVWKTDTCPVLQCKYTRDQSGNRH